MNQYEHRLQPGQPEVVQVRQVAKHTRAGRRYNWKVYMQTDSQADARRILAMLQHHEDGGAHMVYA